MTRDLEHRTLFGFYFCVVDEITSPATFRWAVGNPTRQRVSEGEVSCRSTSLKLGTILFFAHKRRRGQYALAADAPAPRYRRQAVVARPSRTSAISATRSGMRLRILTVTPYSGLIARRSSPWIA